MGKIEELKKRYEELEVVLGFLAHKCTLVSPHQLTGHKTKLNQRDIDRLDFLEEIITILRGAYNNEGIRRWFYRKRRVLSNRPPYFILHEDCWHPSQKTVQKVLELAKAVNTDST
tara:strand:+ start:268 stop:612 length:345 start_codon:yes stop_codon:yes gene_type:complete